MVVFDQSLGLPVPFLSSNWSRADVLALATRDRQELARHPCRSRGDDGTAATRLKRSSSETVC